MGVKIKFDNMGNIESPTLVLAAKSGKKFGVIPATEIVFKDNLNSFSEVSFSVYRYNNGEECHLWKDIRDFRLVYSKEWDLWFEITVELSESDDSVKKVVGRTVCEAELSQVMLFNIEINTEDDIARDDYESPTLLWVEEHPEISLLSRLMEKVPHYAVKHVDETIANIQKTFSFDGTSIYDAFMEIAEEIGCIFIFDSGISKDGGIVREISVYDLYSNCTSCEYRGDFTGLCPDCGDEMIASSFGEDARIFVSSDLLADDISFSSDSDSVKNCFKVEGGDDLINATIRNINPNGTDYIWHITKDMKQDMSKELRDKLSDYDELYENYRTSEEITFDNDSESTAPVVEKYNNIAKKYNYFIKNNAFEDDSFDVDIPEIEEAPFEELSGGTYRLTRGAEVEDDESDRFPLIGSIIGYPALMNVYYDTIDLSVFLQTSLMPSVESSTLTATTELKNLIADKLSPVAVTSLEGLSLTTADSAVLSMAKVLIDPNFKVEIVESSLNDTTWQGKFKVTNYADEDDVAENNGYISVEINDDIETYAKQKIEKALDNKSSEDLSITGLFSKEADKFKTELKQYSLDHLNLFQNCCDGALNILIEQGISEDKTTEAYTKLYQDYYNKSTMISAEIKTREEEINAIKGVYDEEGDLIVTGIQNLITDKRSDIQAELDFEAYLGEGLWLEFCSFRREDKYSNSNYISDGLNNAELFSKAKELFEVASSEIYKSAELQHSISCSLKNLLAIDEFKPLTENFEVGNWIRVRVNDDVYKLRLVSYELTYDDFDKMNVEFSDVLKVPTGISDIKSILDQASSMASSYSAVMHQASQGSSGNKRINNWVENGLSLTTMKIVSSADNQEIVWDNNGFIMKEYFPITDTFSDKQLKIINKGLYVTDDGWQTSRAGIGNFRYKDPFDNFKEKEAYGVIADTIVGNIILGEKVGIYNEENCIKLDKDGFSISNANNKYETENVSYTVNIAMNPNNIENVFYIQAQTRPKDGSASVLSSLLNVNAKDGTLSIGGGNFKVDTAGKLSIGETAFVADSTGLSIGNGNFKVGTDGNLNIGNGSFKVGTDGNLNIGNGSFTVDKDGNAKIKNIVMGGNITWESEPWGDIDVDLDGYMHEDDYTYLTTTKITSTTIESPTIMGGTITGGSIYGGSFWDLDESAYLTLGTEEGDFADLSLYRNGDGKIFTIRDQFGGISMHAYSLNDDDYNGYMFLRSSGKYTHPRGTWDFSEATKVAGIKITFG